ncbi:MAG: PLP-dependent aminotransferase family protein [Gemmatimonadales bacterium]
MTIWCPVLPEGEGPIYKALADAIARAIETGEFHPGDQLPPQRDLADALGVALTTVSRAYAMAERRGLVRGEVGRGTFVRSRVGHLSAEGDPGIVDLRFNTLLPWSQGPELLDSMARLLTAGDPAVLFGYGLHRGAGRHREAGASWMDRAGLATSPEQVLLTVGVQHALTVVLATLTEPGDTVLVEEVTYAGMRTLANVLGVRLVPVELDREGLVPDRLREACARHRPPPKALYCMPTLQNPTSAVMGDERRREIAAIVNGAGVPLLEDDSYGFVLPDIVPLSTHVDQAYYLVGTSKPLLPGLRIGYLRAPAAMVGRLEAVLAATVYATSPIMAEVAAQWIADGTADRVMAWKREQFALRQRRAFDLLGDGDYRSHPRSPHGWLRLPEPWTALDFVAQARLHQVVVAPADEFSVARDAPHAVRLCVGPAPSQAALERALTVLAGMVAQAPEAGRVMV